MKRILFMVLFTLVACDYSSDTPTEIFLLSGQTSIEPNGESYFPMKTNNLWEFQYEYYEDDLRSHIGQVRIDVIDAVEIEYEGENFLTYEVFEQGSSFRQSHPANTLFYCEKSDGLYYFIKRTETDGSVEYEKHCMLKYPIEVGVEWTEFDENNHPTTWVIESSEEMIDLHGVGYSSVKVHSSSSHYGDGIHYFAKGLGRVKYEYFGTSGIIDWRYEFIIVHCEIL